MAAEMLPCNVTLQIDYINSKKIPSQRVIDVKTFANQADGYLRAFCHHRRTLRTFKYANVNQGIDVLTGEVIAPNGLLIFLQQVYQADPARELDGFLADHKPIIDAFAYLMQADGIVKPCERKVILTWIFEQSFLSESFMGYADRVLQSWQVPADARAYLSTLQHINRLFPDLTAELYQYATAVIVADNTITDTEQAALLQMKRVFGINN